MAKLINLAVILFECIGLRISVRARKWKILAFYTQLSNLCALAASIAFVLFEGPWVTVLRYVSACMLTMAFLVTLFVLVPMGGGFRKLMLKNNGLYHHTVCPLLSVFSYIFLDPHAGVWVLPAVLTLVYGLTMTWLNYIRKYDGPYPFFRIHKQGVPMTVLWVLVLLGLISGLSYGIGLIG